MGGPSSSAPYKAARYEIRHVQDPIQLLHYCSYSGKRFLRSRPQESPSPGHCTGGASAVTRSVSAGKGAQLFKYAFGLQAGCPVTGAASFGDHVLFRKDNTHASPEDAWQALVVQALANHRPGDPPLDIRLPPGVMLKATQAAVVTEAHSGVRISGGVGTDGAALVEIMCTHRLDAVFNISGCARAGVGA